jgi:hypothetical protein
MSVRRAVSAQAPLFEVFVESVALVVFSLVVIGGILAVSFSTIRAQRRADAMLQAAVVEAERTYPAAGAPQPRPCSWCGGREIWVIDEVKEPDHKNNNVARPRRAHSWQGHMARVDVGTVCAFVCAGCGHMDCFARDARGGLTAVAAQEEGGVRLVRVD